MRAGFHSFLVNLEKKLVDVGLSSSAGDALCLNTIRCPLYCTYHCIGDVKKDTV